MTGFDQKRRRFLTSTMLGGLGFVTGVHTGHAFTRQPMTAEQHKAYMTACTGTADPYHAQLIQQAAAKLKTRMGEAEVEQVINAMRCPICGCSLTAALPSVKAKQAR